MSNGLVFGDSDSFLEDDGVVFGYVDSDFAGCLGLRKSLTGYVFTAYGTAISWKANLQKVVALSSTEAEYMTLTEVVKEVLWLLGLIKELKIDQQQVCVFCDNQGAIQLSKNQVSHERTKHADIKVHFIRDIIVEDVVLVKKASTKDNPADMTTKPLPSNKFEYCLELVVYWRLRC